MNFLETAKQKILLVSGSTRKGSFNTMLIEQAGEMIKREGGDPTIISLADYPLAIYNADDENLRGIPEAALKLKEIFKMHQGIFFASPEANASVSSLLKNTLDWVSRSTSNESGKIPYAGKVAAIAGATPSALGAHRGLIHLRTILSSVGMLVLPDVLGIPNAHKAFNKSGELTEVRYLHELQLLARSLVITSMYVSVSQRKE